MFNPEPSLTVIINQNYDHDRHYHLLNLFELARTYAGLCAEGL